MPADMERMMTADVGIVGAGAAGMFAAAVLAERAPGCRVAVFEKKAHPLAKVRVSGGGRCNLTHQCSDLREFCANYPRGGRELLGPLTRFGPAETVAWFEAHGVPLVTLEDGCLFPRSDDAADVIRALLDTASRGRVAVRTRSDVAALSRTEQGFVLTLADGARATCAKLLVATGGGAFLEGLGHTIEPCVPSLFAFNATDPAFTALAGIVVDPVRLRGAGVQAEGALLIAHRGVSGPAVLRLSAFGARAMAERHYRFPLSIDWLPAAGADAVVQALAPARAESPRKRVGSWSPLGLPARLWALLVARAGVGAEVPWQSCPAPALRRIAEQVGGFQLAVTGRSRHREEFVTCGGVRLKEVDFRTMESRLAPGLYFAGEVLDIDGLTGGFNLQAAWTTGYLAAQALSGC